MSTLLTQPNSLIATKAKIPKSCCLTSDPGEALVHFANTTHRVPVPSTHDRPSRRNYRVWADFFH